MAQHRQNHRLFSRSYRLRDAVWFGGWLGDLLGGIGKVLEGILGGTTAQPVPVRVRRPRR